MSGGSRTPPEDRAAGAPRPPAPASGGTYTLIGPDGGTYRSTEPGSLGGHRRGRLYGRLDCPSALRAIARGGYVGQRVFFVDEATARAAGYRPCAVCLPAQYAHWKTHGQGTTRQGTTRR